MLTRSFILFRPQMPANDGWSDSDSGNESALTDVETTVELGIPNGEITSTEDLEDPMVSRIGGVPVRLHFLFALKYSVLNFLFLIHAPKSTMPVLLLTPCCAHQSFLSKSPPPLDSAHCKICASPAELLVQLWCPLQDSPYDRVLYVWGCSRRGCQRKDGGYVDGPPPPSPELSFASIKTY